MLSTNRTLAALARKQEAWQRARARAAREAHRVEQAFAELTTLPRRELEARIEAVPWSGARPTGEYEAYPGQVVPFAHRFDNHEQCRRWAREAILGQPTFAVDGSQISPMQEYPLPVAAAQVGWYLNHHSPGVAHEKDLAIEVLVGDELETTDVDGRRFQMEVATLTSFIEQAAEMEPRPVCFYDGPLVLSFALPYPQPKRAAYVEAVSRLLDASEAARVPVVGYIAGSAAKDLVAMLTAATLLPAMPDLPDHVAVGPALAGWGDRTVTYLCARDDGVLETYPRHGPQPAAYRIAFCYLNGASGSPARLEFPSWLLDEPGELERVLDVVRAECAVGLGYPYCIEAADETAVLGGREREAFRALLERFAEEHGLGLSRTPKARSKQHRRHGG